MQREKRKLIRERVARHRERKAEAAEIARERATERAEMVSEYGEEKVLDLEHYNELAVVSLEILNYLTGRETTWLKVTSPTLDGDLQHHFDHLEKEFSDTSYSGHLDNQFERFSRMGLLPRPVDAANYFRELYVKWKIKGDNNESH